METSAHSPAQRSFRWGKVRAGAITRTNINYTGQRSDGTGLWYYHVRMYYPSLGRFVTAGLHERACRKEKLMELFHNLRNRLNTIQSSTDLLVDLAMSAGYPSELIEQIRADIQHAINAQARFLSELQLVALLRQERLVLHCMSVDLPALVARVVQQLDSEYQVHQCFVTISVDDVIPPVWADESRLDQILYRVLDNAVQSTRNNAESPNVVLVRIAADEHNATCCIDDNGCGIASDDLAHLVAQLERAVPDARSENITLELSACTQLLRLHGGTLAVTSPGIGHGTTVCIQLPSAAPTDLH